MAKFGKSFSISSFLYGLGEQIQFRPESTFSSDRKEEKRNPILEKWHDRIQPYKLKVKVALAKMAEQSAILAMFDRMCRWFFSMRIRSFGIFFFSSGFLQIISYFLSSYYPVFPGDESNLLFGVAQIFLTLLCSFSRGDVCGALKHSFLFRVILEPLFGIQEAQLPSGKSRDGLIQMLFLGLACGVLSVLLSPIFFLKLIFCFILVLSILFFPEAGMATALAGCLFLSREALYLLIGITLVSFASKCAVGKRSFSFSAMDLPVLLFLLPLGFSAQGKLGSCLALFFLYFCVSGLLRTVSGLERLNAVVTASALLTSALLVIQQALFFVQPSLFVRFPHLESVFFIKPTVETGILFAMMCPMALVSTRKSFPWRKRLFGGISFLLLLCALAVIGSNSVWLAAIIGICVYVLFSHRASLILLCVSGLSAIILLHVLPQAISVPVLEWFGLESDFLHPSLEKSESLLQFFYGNGGIIWCLLFFFLLGFVLYETVRFCTGTTREEAHFQVLGALSAVVVFFSISIQEVTLDDRVMAVFVCLIAIPRSARRAALREEIRLPY